jgi:very-short-patch-repair endonuclease
MSSLTVFAFNSQEIRFVEGKPVASDVAKALGYVDPQSTISKKVSLKNKGVATAATPGGMQSITILELEGVKELLCKSRKSLEKKQEIAKHFGIDLSVVTHSNIETETIKIIKDSFVHLPSVTQFFISGYRIDLYFPAHRIAIECDEFDHQDYNSQKEEARQDSISKLLGCQFIRYNPNKEGFNIGEVINKILQLIYC